jgi:outer membrane beta-barrel protein
MKLRDSLTTGGMVLTIAVAAAASATEYAADDTGEVSAIQNRTYHLGQEFEFSVSVLPYDAFYKAVAPEISYTVHFTDSFAWEAVRFGYAQRFDTNLKTQLLSLGTQPTAFEEVNLFLSSDLMWSPIYAKMALINKAVIYGELYGVVGGGAYNTTQAWRPAPNIGLGGRLFLSRVVSLRLEVREALLIESSLPSVVDINLGLSINFGSSE